MARRLYRKDPYDGMWSIMASQASIAVSFVKLYNKKLHLIATLQEGDEEEHLKRYVLGNNFLYRILIRPWHILVFRYADTVTATSAYLKDRALRSGVHVPIEIIPNGVNVKFFSKKCSEKDIDFLKQKFGKKDADLYLITTSRLVYKNAIDDVLRALSFLPKTIKFIVLGTGPEEKKLKKLVHVLKISNRVFFAGHVEQNNIPCYFAMADIFIRPSRSEGFGNSFIEAMAAGIPVIATQEGGIFDFLFDAKRNSGTGVVTGWAVDKDSPDQIASTIHDIINHPEESIRIVQSAKKLVSEKYDWDFVAQQMQEKVFDKI